MHVLMQKSFFKARTVPEMIQYAPKQIYTHRALVERIMDLQDTDVIELRSPFAPLIFKAKHRKSTALADRSEYRHGSLLTLHQPRTQQEAYEYARNRITPLMDRMRSFDALNQIPQEAINYMGISWRPVQGRDTRLRIVPFDALLEGAKLYAYSEQANTKITIDDRYTAAQRAASEGATIFCQVPSRTQKKPRYQVNLAHVPVVENVANYATILSLRSQFEEGRESQRTSYLHHLRFNQSDNATSSDVHVFGPHEIAAYLKIINQTWKGINHTVPLTMNPFPLPSRVWAGLYDRLNNNVLVYDPTLQTKPKLRHLHLVEKCRILARSIPVLGAYETMYWDPSRDGKVRDYWSQS